MVEFPGADLAGLRIPCFEAVGRSPGPRLVILAGVHGCEYPSMVAAREFMTGIREDELAGTVVALPLVNVPAFRARTPFVVPVDGKNLNRCFPGDPDGSYTEVLAHHVFERFVRGSDAVVDLHAGDLVESLVPFTLYDESSVADAARALADCYGTSYVVRQSRDGAAIAGSTSAAAAAVGVPAIIAEAGGRGLVERDAVTTHLTGLRNILGHLGMAPAQPGVVPAARHCDQFVWLRSPAAGWWEPSVVAGQEVAAGGVLGRVLDLFGDERVVVSAPVDGVALFVTVNPSVAADGVLVAIGG